MEKPIVTIYREESTDEGTYGILEGEGIRLQTLELPWRNNQRQISCIPEGQYPCRVTRSEKFKQNLYELFGVTGRGNVRIHSGNHAGDTAKGFYSDVQGCILLGMERKPFKGQKAVVQSRDAVKKFMAVMEGREFILHVKWE